MRISLRLQKLAYSLGTILCVAAAVSVLVWAAGEPAITTAQKEGRESQVKQSAEPTAATHHEPTKVEFAKFWQLALRRPLYDPPPPEPEVHRPPPLNVELLGTIVEADNSLAMIKSEQGSVSYLRVGQAVGPPDSPAHIVEIREAAVVLERAEERITLAVRGQEERR